MSLGYASPLYALSCDQRAPLVEALLGFHEPLDRASRAQLAAVKAALYAGFRRAGAVTGAHRAGMVVVDPEWGLDIYRHAAARGSLTAVTLDPPDGDAADLEPAAAVRTLDEVPAPFAKVRFDVALGARFERALAQLARVMAPVRARDRRLAVELRGDWRIALHAMQRLQDAGVEADVWILDPLDGEAFGLAAAIARRDGRDGVGCLVQLGGDDMSARRDAQAAARAPGFIGFGADPALMRADVQAWRAGWVTWDGLVAHIAARYCALIDVFAPRDRFLAPLMTLQAHG
jgi:myo-inositol catabolism protein IolC